MVKNRVGGERKSHEKSLVTGLDRKKNSSYVAERGSCSHSRNINTQTEGKESRSNPDNPVLMNERS